jgi:type II secretory pathway pseudopilin PulG
MITLVVMGVILGLVMGAMYRSQNQTTRLTKIAEERQMARTAIQLIERETRMAGSGWGRTLVHSARSGVSDSLNAVNPGYGGIARSDSFRTLGAWTVDTKLVTSNMALTTDAMTVLDTTGFRVGDLVVVTDRDNRSAHLFQLTQVQGSPAKLLHANTSPWNTGHTGWPAGGYAIGSYVYRVTLATYRYDSTSFRRPALVRVESGQPIQVVAYNVDGFHVWYDMQDGTRTRNPADLSLVDKIVPVVLTKVTDPRQPTLRDSVWADVRPRTF